MISSLNIISSRLKSFCVLRNLKNWLNFKIFSTCFIYHMNLTVCQNDCADISSRHQFFSVQTVQISVMETYLLFLPHVPITFGQLAKFCSSMFSEILTDKRQKLRRNNTRKYKKKSSEPFKVYLNYYSINCFCFVFNHIRILKNS